jgi:plasmid stabilization system protein ParE
MPPYRLLLSREARQDVREAKAWFRKKSRAAEAKFVRSLEGYLERIETAPFLYPFIYQSVQRVVMDDFSYSILYEVDRDRVRIFALVHHRQDPDDWMDRL